ncbi:ATP-binding protein [Falsiroseomonas sp.]|uniref:ATP-binding protein n=1 Tax=Falsiroseomonas sp. TaxID=2870721 RepID=UPI003F718367
MLDAGPSRGPSAGTRRRPAFPRLKEAPLNQAPWSRLRSGLQSRRAVGPGTLRGHLLGIALFAAALAGRFALAGVLPPAGFPFLTFFPAVLLATYFGGMGPGLLTGALSTLAAWYFFIPPVHSFALATTADVIAIGFFIAILLVDVLVIDFMNAAVNRLEEEKARSAGLAEELRRMNASLEDRVRLEVAAREAVQLKLAQDLRLRALGQLAGGVAHDFNNIMQAVQSGASLMRRRAESPDAVRHLAQMVEEATQRGASVTRRLLSFARRGELRLEPVDPASLARGLQEILWHTLGGRVTVVIEAEEPLPALVTDRGQLETVLVNLATNARDAMPGGGTLTISATEERVTAAGLHGLDPGHYVKFTVRDTGAGMTAEVLARAGEPFFSTKGAGAGTGLGLAMARGFAEQSAGAMAIDSVPGAGTAISIWLPAAEAQDLREPAAAALLAPARPLRILLVDDDALVRDFLAESLGEQGFTVLRASGGAGALSLLSAGERPDIVVTDYEMPGITGLALIDAVRDASGPTPMPAILLTGNLEETLDGQLAGRVAIDPLLLVLRKPILVEELAGALLALDGLAQGGAPAQHPASARPTPLI